MGGVNRLAKKVLNLRSNPATRNIQRKVKMLMSKMSRREFTERVTICSGAAGLLVASAANLAANPLGLPIGSQVWPLRSMLKDFPAFVKLLAEIDVTRLELCSPIGYGAEFSSLA